MPNKIVVLDASDSNGVGSPGRTPVFIDRRKQDLSGNGGSTIKQELRNVFPVSTAYPTPGSTHNGTYSPQQIRIVRRSDGASYPLSSNSMVSYFLKHHLLHKYDSRMVMSDLLEFFPDRHLHLELPLEWFRYGFHC